MYIVLMNEGVQNQQKELKKKKLIRTQQKTIVVDIPEGSKQIDKVYGKVDKQESILKTAQKNEDLHREYLKNKKEKEKHLTVKTKSEIEKTVLKKSQPVEKKNICRIFRATQEIKMLLLYKNTE